MHTTSTQTREFVDSRTTKRHVPVFQQQFVTALVNFSWWRYTAGVRILGASPTVTQRQRPRKLDGKHGKSVRRRGMTAHVLRHVAKDIVQLRRRRNRSRRWRGARHGQLDSRLGPDVTNVQRDPNRRRSRKPRRGRTITPSRTAQTETRTITPQTNDRQTF